MPFFCCLFALASTSLGVRCLVGSLSCLPGCVVFFLHRLRYSGPAPRREVLSCQENAAEERQTEGILQCQANIAQMAYESLIERSEGLRTFRRETQKQILWFQMVHGCSPMLQYVAELSLRQSCCKSVRGGQAGPRIYHRRYPRMPIKRRSPNQTGFFIIAALLAGLLSEI